MFTPEEVITYGGMESSEDRSFLKISMYQAPHKGLCCAFLQLIVLNPNVKKYFKLFVLTAKEREAQRG